MEINYTTNTLGDISDRLEGIVDRFFLEKPGIRIPQEISEREYTNMQYEIQRIHSEYELLSSQQSQGEVGNNNRILPSNINCIGKAISEVFLFLQQDFPPSLKGVYKIQDLVYNATGDLIHGGCHFKTSSGQRVRSRYEKWIADIFTKYRIEYDYEPEFTLGGRTLHPDWGEEPCIQIFIYLNLEFI